MHVEARGTLSELGKKSPPTRKKPSFKKFRQTVRGSKIFDDVEVPAAAAAAQTKLDFQVALKIQPASLRSLHQSCTLARQRQKG